MDREPFIIDVNEADLPNLAQDEDGSFGYIYDKTNIWQQNQQNILPVLVSISEKLDKIIILLTQNGRE